MAVIPRYDSDISQEPAQLGRVAIGGGPVFQQPPPRASVSITFRPISNGWILTSLYSDRPVDFEGDIYFKDIGTLLSEVESRLINAGFHECGNDR